MSKTNQLPGNRMRQIRIERGITVEKVSKATFYSNQAIQHAETGREYQYGEGIRRDKRRDRFWKAMSDFYGVPEEELRRWPE